MHAIVLGTPDCIEVNNHAFYAGTPSRDLMSTRISAGIDDHFCFLTFYNYDP